MRKKLLSIIITTAMIAALTACGSKTNKTSETAAVNAEAETEAKTTKTFDIKADELKPLEDEGIITGVEDLKIAEGTTIKLNELIFTDATIVKGVDVDDSKADYNKAGTYKVKYTITFDGNKLNDYVTKKDIKLTFDTDADTIIVKTTVTIEVLTEEEVKEAIAEAEAEAKAEDNSDNDTDKADDTDKSDKSESAKKAKKAKTPIITNDTKDDVKKENQSKANDNAVESKPAPEPETTKAAVKTEKSTDNVIKADEKTTTAKATEKTTEKSTTAKATEKSTTAKQTEKATEKTTTAKQTEKATEKATTAKPTEKVTEKQTTAKPTEKVTEKQTTAKPTERVTEKPTEAPTVKPVHTHSYNSSITKQPTCDSTGVRTYTCSCGSSYTESIPATGHKWEHHDAVYETATKVIKEAYDEPVYEERMVCNGCGAIFSGDSAGADAAGEHIMAADFYGPCQNYSSKYVQVGTIHHDAVTETYQKLKSPAYDVCKTCDARK